MSIYKELSYENYIELVKGIRFCILSPNEIKHMSVAEITKSETYQGLDPVVNGLFDPRMGVLDHNKLCHTCEQKNTFCPGHFGHISLAKPVFYIQFFDIVRKILKCVCWRCSKLLVDLESPQVKAILSKKYSRQKKWEMMYKLCSKVRRCGQETLDGCKAKQPDKIYREPIVKIVMEWKDLDTENEEMKKQVLNAEEVLRILQRITNEDAEALGFHRKYNRPEWMICTVLPVPPPAVRPSVRTDTGLRSEDDLTHKLSDIVKNNNTLKAKIEKGASKEQVDIATQVLQYHVATFIDNNIPGINPAQQRTGRLLKSLTERLKSKEGRIRGNLMGKRVDFSARSVITPDPNISIDELGVPIKIAMNLTFPEVVNSFNREKLLQLVRNGPDVYPGAKCLRQGNRTFLLKNKDRNNIELKDGDIVERHMMNGDYVLFNRQPSLHRMSMMGHRVVVMPYNTFRSNPSVCPCFNSDYDGDEMNAHLPQSIVTMNELVELAAVPTQIISPRECKPIIAIVQDVPLGVYRLTKDDVYIGHKQLMNLMSLNPRYLGYVPSPATKEKGLEKWTGRQILSTIIPKNINLTLGDKSSDDYVHIVNGEIKQGVINKRVYQNMTNGLIHSIYNECGPDETRMFFDNTQRIICDWLVSNGFSVGISDLIVDTTTQDMLKQTIHKMKVQVYDIIAKVHTGKFENKSIVNNNEYFEREVNNILNKTSSDAGDKGLSNINDKTNRMINMILSGSKGNKINIAQMIACLGQVNVEGKRIAYGFENRTLPHYAKYDDGPESRGFVESSFIKGLNPQEFFFHSMGGREGLIDTAVKTSETGYLQRKLVKAMEDCKIGYDHTVRNASGAIVQYLYGEDGMDPTKIEKHKLPYIEKDYAELRDMYLFTDKDDVVLKGLIEENVFQAFKASKDWEEKMKAHFEQVLTDREFIIRDIFKNKLDDSIMYPVSFHRIITNACAMFKCTGQLDLNPMYVLTELNKLCENVYVTKWNKGNQFFQILARAFMSPKRVMLKYRFDKATFDFVIQQIKHRFYDAIAHPSEMVGVISAQSIGEPCTQMTLNTFHLSGVSSASKAVRGVPRMKELLSVTKNIKAPALTIHLDKSIRRDKNESKKVLNTIQTTYFKDIVKHSKIYFDPNDFDTTIADDKLFLATYKEFIKEELMEISDLTPWLLRFEFDKEKMKEYDITMLDLGNVVYDFYRDTVSCMFSDDNSNNLVMRVKLPESSDEDRDIVTELKALEKNIMENIIINGVKGVNKVVMSNKEYSEYNPEIMKFEKTNEWVLETNGSNLIDILGHAKVDATKTISNDVSEIYELLGIEAARQALYKEMSDIIEDANLYVNYRHISLLVDTMTNKGYLLSIDRHGINRVDIGPLAKCSFEEVTDMLVKAGIFSEMDKIGGVSANIMLGQIPPYGTGETDVLIDAKKLSELAVIDEEPDDTDDYISHVDPRVIEEYCDIDNLGFGFQLPTKDSTIERLNVPIKVT